MINKVILLGNVGSDPETHHFDETSSVSKFSLATTEKWKTKEGEKKEETEWHNVICYKGLAKVVESYVKKGSKLYVEGKIKTRSYDDKDGNKRYVTEIICHNLQMLDSKPSEQSEPIKKDISNPDTYKNELGQDIDNVPF